MKSKRRKEDEKSKANKTKAEEVNTQISIYTYNTQIYIQQIMIYAHTIHKYVYTKSKCKLISSCFSDRNYRIQHREGLKRIRSGLKLVSASFCHGVMLVSTGFCLSGVKLVRLLLPSIWWSGSTFSWLFHIFIFSSVHSLSYVSKARDGSPWIAQYFLFPLIIFVQVAISSENPYVIGRFRCSFGFVLELTDTDFSGFISSLGSLNVEIFSAPGRQYKKLRSFVQKPCISNAKKKDTWFLHKTPVIFFCRWRRRPYCPKIPMCWPWFEAFQLAPTGLWEWKTSWCIASRTTHCK